MTDAANNNRLIQWLFNPFKFVAGFQALLIGLAIILISGFIGSFNLVHFDGVLDIHIGWMAPMRFFLAEGLIDWICMAVPLLFFGLIVSRSAFRIIDVFGTQALARWPYLIAAVVMLPDANLRVVGYLMSIVSQHKTEVISPSDVAIFCLAMMVSLLMLIWMVTLMYRAYAVSCNIKGARAIVTFIVSLLGAEVLSKFVILSLSRALS